MLDVTWFSPGGWDVTAGVIKCQRRPVLASCKWVMAAAAVARPAGCRQRCSRRQRRAQTGCRRRRRSRTETAPGASAHSSAVPPRPGSDPPPRPPGEPRSWGWDTEERPAGRSVATPPDQTPHSLSTRRVRNRKRGQIGLFSPWIRKFFTEKLHFVFGIVFSYYISLMISNNSEGQTCKKKNEIK